MLTRSAQQRRSSSVPNVNPLKSLQDAERSTSSLSRCDRSISRSKPPCAKCPWQMTPRCTQISRGWISWIPLSNWMSKIIPQQINSPLDRQRPNLFQQGHCDAIRIPKGHILGAHAPLELSTGLVTSHSPRHTQPFLSDFVSRRFRKRPQKSTYLCRQIV